jgi:hypothetical protein
VLLATATSHYFNVILHSKEDNYQHFGGTSALRVDDDSSRILYKTTWLHIPDLPPCNFYLFIPLKQALKDSRFCQMSTSKPQKCSGSTKGVICRGTHVSMGYMTQCPW